MVSSSQDAVVAGSGMLTDGGIETRIMSETDVPLPEHVQVAALVTDPTRGPVLRDIYESYVDAASPFGLPVIIGTPTFRASPDFVRRAGLGGDEAVRQLNAEAAQGHREIKARSKHPVLGEEGVVLDETQLHAAIERIDVAASPAPLFYSISCVHPSIAARALRDEEVFSDLVACRLVEFKANVSALSTEELVKLDHPEGDDPERLAAGMWEIHEQFGLRILGGCCRTDDRHIRALAARMAGTEVRDRGLE